ncbi:MAG: glucosaminidase domain-containing protein [Chloroflexi bacterium]|nr:glucosaminidase domain-containing protein [Chloroflexota bacterium]
MRQSRWATAPALALLRWSIHLVALVVALLGLFHARPGAQLAAAPAPPEPDTQASLSPPPVPPGEVPPSAQALVQVADQPQERDAGLPRGIAEYVVREGDTLRAIAQRFGVPTEVLVWSNDLPLPDVLKVGQRLLVPPASGLIHRVRPADTIRGIASLYHADVPAIIDTNKLSPPFALQLGQPLVVPNGVVPKPVATPAPKATATTVPRASPTLLPSPSPTPVPRSSPTPLPSLAPTAVSTLPPPAPGASVPGATPSPQAESQPLAAAVASPRATATPQPRSPEEAFIASIAPGAQASQRATGVPASVTIAQAILESSWGQSHLAREANNLFGIKAREKPGSAGTVWMDTWEVSGGNVVQREPFRAYASVADSLVDHGRFFVENARYQRAMAVKDNPRRFAQAIQDAGYATDPAYSAKLIGLMDRYNLYRFD